MEAIEKDGNSLDFLSFLLFILFILLFIVHIVFLLIFYYFQLFKIIQKYGNHLKENILFNIYQSPKNPTTLPQVKGDYKTVQVFTLNLRCFL